MPDQRIVGDDESEAASRIDEWLRLPDAAKLKVRGINNSRLAVTEIRYDHPNYGSSGSGHPPGCVRGRASAEAPGVPRAHL